MLDSESEDRIYTQVITVLRDHESKMAKKYKPGAFTFWDSDEAALVSNNGPVVLSNTRFGRSIVFTRHDAYRDPEGRLTLDFDAIIEVHYANESLFDQVFMVNEVFAEIDGKVAGLRASFESDKSKEVWEYCKKTDKFLVSEIGALKKAKLEEPTKSLYERMLKIVGSPHDRLLRRIKYLIDLSEAYKKDKETWKFAIKRIGSA